VDNDSKQRLKQLHIELLRELNGVKIPWGSTSRDHEHVVIIQVSPTAHERRPDSCRLRVLINDIHKPYKMSWLFFEGEDEVAEYIGSTDSTLVVLAQATAGLRTRKDIMDAWERS